MFILKTILEHHIYVYNSYVNNIFHRKIPSANVIFVTIVICLKSLSFHAHVLFQSVQQFNSYYNLINNDNIMLFNKLCICTKIENA